mmetsp:Transcript_48000/g.121908  ORF Transcript_48000/g.121908 Transcript_48000/m.121908 type:complete len:279 (-) Transcript_48000:96-932(-)
MRPSCDCRRQWNSDRPQSAKAMRVSPWNSGCLTMCLAWRQVPSMSTITQGPTEEPSPASVGAIAAAMETASEEGNSTKARPPTSATRCRNLSRSAAMPCRKTSQPGSRCSSSFPVLDARPRSRTCIQTAHLKRSVRRWPLIVSLRPARQAQMQCCTVKAHLSHFPCWRSRSGSRSAQLAVRIAQRSRSGRTATASGFSARAPSPLLRPGLEPAGGREELASAPVHAAQSAAAAATSAAQWENAHALPSLHVPFVAQCRQPGARPRPSSCRSAAVAEAR